MKTDKTEKIDELSAGVPPSDNDPVRKRKILALWIAVGGTTAFIIVMWLLLLPMQIGEIRLPNAKNLSRWQVLREEPPPAASFEESLDQIRDKLEQLTENLEPETPQNKPATTIDIQQLQQKLEAAALRNGVTATNESQR